MVDEIGVGVVICSYVNSLNYRCTHGGILATGYRQTIGSGEHRLKNSSAT